MAVTLTGNPESPSPNFNTKSSSLERRLQPSGVEEMAKTVRKEKQKIEMSPANISEINMEMSSAEKVCYELRPTAPVWVCVCVCARTAA